MGEDAGRDERLLKVKTDAMRLLTFRPRAVEELRARLREKKHDEALIAEVIALFEKQGLLNDQQFARLYAGSIMHSRPSGRRLVERDLRRKGLSESVIRKTLAEQAPEGDEKNAARQLVQARLGKMTGISADKKKARLFGFLKRRGFATSTIFSVLGELLKKAELENISGHDDD